MKKILFYINSIDNGGAERVIVNLANYFSEKSYETLLVTSYYSLHEYSLCSSVRRLSLEKEEIQQSRIKRNLSRIKKLREICKKEKPDVLVSFMKEPNFRAILATRGLHIKTIVSVRNDPCMEYSGTEGKIVGKVLLPLADGCVFQTKDAKNWFPKRLQNKSRIIYNAVKEEFYQVERKPQRGEIVTCGRLTSQKNHAMLIEAFAEVTKKIPYATLKIYGEGTLRKTLQEQINTLNLQDKVSLLGVTDNVTRALETADLFVLSSDFEGMPNALMEAMAEGVPSISTDCPCGGPKELFGDELSVQMIPVGDSKELSNKIIEYFENKEETKKKLSDKFKETAQKFRPSKINKQWDDYIDSVLG